MFWQKYAYSLRQKYISGDIYPVRILLALLVMLASSFASATNYPAKIHVINLEGGAAVYAVNDGPATLEISLELINSINVSSDQAWPVTATIPPPRHPVRGGRGVGLYAVRRAAHLYPSQRGRYEPHAGDHPARDDG